MEVGRAWLFILYDCGLEMVFFGGAKIEMSPVVCCRTDVLICPPGGVRVGG